MSHAGPTAPILCVAATPLLLWPAIYNGFPLVFPDTGAYFAVAWAESWTLDRSGFYGLLFQPMDFGDAELQLWLGLALQSAAVAAAVLLVIHRSVPEVRPLVALALILLLASVTSLPWHTSQLMPDALAGMTVLLVWLACWRDPSQPGTPLLWLAAYAVALMHYTFVPLIFATAAGALVILLALGTAAPAAIARRAAVAAAVGLAVVGSQTIANGVALNRWTPAPLGPMFLFARLHEDGLVQPWLAKHCPSGDVETLCSAQPSFPRDSQSLLWGEESRYRQLVLDSSGANTDTRFVAELRRATFGSIAERPLKFAASALRSGADQFVHFQVLDDECPEVCRKPTSAVYGWFKKYRPQLLPDMLSSRQIQGMIPRGTWRAITTPVATIALLLLPLAFIAAWRRRDALSCSLIAAIVAALVANAIVTGGLSDVHDRYQSRLVWLAPFGMLIVFLRRWYHAALLGPSRSPRNS